MSETRPQALWRHGGFLRLWIGQTLSQFGEQFGNLAIPVIAVSVLHATAFEVGLLNTAQTLAFLVIGLPAGAWIDRWIKRRVMLRVDLMRAVLLTIIPVLWLTNVLEFWHLLVIATIVGAGSVFFDVSYQSYVPFLVGREHISDANGKLETTAQVARIAGPAAAGGLIAVLAAPLLLVATAFTYLFSFGALTSIRTHETPVPKEGRRPLVLEIREGLAFVFRHPLLVRIVMCTGISNLFSTVSMTMLPVLVLRTLDLGAVVFGIAGSVGAVGGLLGAMFSSRLSRVLGEGTVIPVTALAMGVAGFLFPAMALLPSAAVAVLVVAEVIVLAAVVVYNVAQVSFRQRICPPHLLGRMNASIRFVVWGVMPLGGLLSAFLSVWVGVVPTMFIGAAGALLAAAPVVFSPLLGMRKLPD